MTTVRAQLPSGGATRAMESGGARAQTGDSPVMLIAKPGLQPPYGETVLIAVSSGDSEHAGFIVNRPLNRTLAQILPDSPAAQKAPQPVRLGGSVMLNTMFAVLQVRNGANDATIPLFDDVHMAVRADSIHEIVRRRPDEARYFLGFVRWARGELADEIERGCWYAMRPQADVLFRDDIDDIWAGLVRQARGAPVPEFFAAGAPMSAHG